MAQIRIAHLLHSLDGGGTEHALVRLLRLADHQQFAHVIITQRGAGKLCAELPPQVAVLPLNLSGRRRFACYRLAGCLHRRRIDILHARNTGTWFDATLAAFFKPRLRLVLGFHGLQEGGSFTRSQRSKARLGLRAGARFTSVSRTGIPQLMAECGIPRQRIVHLPNGVDLDAFQSAQDDDAPLVDMPLVEQEQSPPPANRPELIIGTVGSLTPVKKFDLLIRSFAHLKQSVPSHLRLVIVGDGPLRGKLQRLAVELNVAQFVQFAGWQANAADWLRRFDIFVSTSSSEGMSNAVLEAMACGLPIVATPAGDTPHMVRDGLAGRIVADRLPKTLADALAPLCRSAPLRAQFGKNARARAESFSLLAAAERYGAFYRRLSPGKPAETPVGRQPEWSRA